MRLKPRQGSEHVHARRTVHMAPGVWQSAAYRTYGVDFETRAIKALLYCLCCAVQTCLNLGHAGSVAITDGRHRQIQVSFEVALSIELTAQNMGRVLISALIAIKLIH